MITAILFISFRLINIYVLNLENRNKKIIGLENATFFVGIVLAQILINRFGDASFNADGVIQLAGIIIVYVSLIPFNREIKKVF